MKSIWLLLLTMCLTIATNEAYGQTVIYVDGTAVGASDGSSWTDAYTTLSCALEFAQDGDTVLIAQGTYCPDQIGICDEDENGDNGSHGDRFKVENAITLIGGFPQGGGLRDHLLFPVLISGDLGILGDMSDNCNNVLTLEYPPGLGVIELIGMTICDGNADGLSALSGGAMKVEADVILRDIVITHNHSDIGGAIFFGIENCTVQLFNCTLHDNSSGNSVCFDHPAGVILTIGDQSLIDQ